VTHAITAAQLPGVLARLTVREDEERQAQKLYRVLTHLGALAIGPMNRNWSAEDDDAS
jgi:hypothetical protein